MAIVLAAGALNVDPIANTVAVLNFTTDAVAAVAQTVNVGFQPRLVRVHNITDSIKNEWMSGMVAGSKIATTALGAVSYSATLGVTVANGTITLDPSILVASKTYILVAER